MTTNKTYAYIRVSNKDQNEGRQLDALAPLHIPSRQTYIDKQSGKDFNRPAYKRLMKRLKPGDLLVVKSIDRLGAITPKSLNNGASSPRRKRRTSRCWICRFWTPPTARTCWAPLLPTSPYRSCPLPRS